MVIVADLFTSLWESLGFTSTPVSPDTESSLFVPGVSRAQWLGSMNLAAEIELGSSSDSLIGDSLEDFRQLA